jgi:hypothetical protein
LTAINDSAPHLHVKEVTWQYFQDLFLPHDARESPHYDLQLNKKNKKKIILINRINTLIKNPWAEAIPFLKESFSVIYSKMKLFCYIVEY